MADSTGKSRMATGLILAVALLPGCATTPKPMTSLDRSVLKARCVNHLKSAVAYRANAAVRVEAIEALESVRMAETLPWIRSAMQDEHRAVRFAACVALGRLEDSASLSGLRRCARDTDDSVRAAAWFALHRLGHTEETGRIAGFLIDHPNVAVRRNAVLVMGLLGEPGGIKVLARAMTDRDAGVRQHVLEAMARLGNPEAKQELAFMANTGVGAEEVFALNALATTGDRIYLDTFRYKLGTASHLETRLAAARGLGRLGVDDGATLALRALAIREAPIADPDDPPEGQLLRIRLLALSALAAIDRVDVVPELVDVLEESKDPRIEVSAARAILCILAADRERALPFIRREPGLSP